jgi:hypothetical protein
MRYTSQDQLQARSEPAIQQAEFAASVRIFLGVDNEQMSGGDVQ